MPIREASEIPALTSFVYYRAKRTRTCLGNVITGVIPLGYQSLQQTERPGLNEINFFVDEEFRNTVSVFCKLSRICHPQRIMENKRHQKSYLNKREYNLLSYLDDEI